jgi:hypothetical protein
MMNLKRSLTPMGQNAPPKYFYSMGQERYGIMGRSMIITMILRQYGSDISATRWRLSWLGTNPKLPPHHL